MTVDDVVGYLAELDIAARVRKSYQIDISCPFAALPNSGHRKTVDSHPSLGIWIHAEGDGGTWFCFTCGRKGNLVGFFLALRPLFGDKSDEIANSLRRILDRDPEEIAASIPDYSDHFRDKEGVQYPVFPETWLSAYAGKAPRYIVDRGVALKTCRDWEIGFDRHGHRVFYPVRDRSGLLVGAVAGAIHRTFPKYRNMWAKLHKGCRWPIASKEGDYFCESCARNVTVAEVQDGFKKSRFLYGEHKAKQGGTAIIVEGVVDTLKVSQAVATWKKGSYFPLGLLGSSVSQEQADKVINLTGDKVISFLDNDMAGEKGNKELKRYLLRRTRFFKALYPDGVSDPGEMSQEQIREAILNAKVIFS